ncbi:MAG: Dps family protein [Candidatus Krumholzibacteriia bacterium]
MSNQAVIQSLNGILADSIVLHQKLHHYHWRVQGQGFFLLHGKFEELYDHFAAVMDQIAERILMIDGEPIGTLAGAVEHAAIAETEEVPAARKMVADLAADLETFGNRVSQVVSAAEQAGDRGTANLLDPILDELDKTRWMLKAFLAS